MISWFRQHWKKYGWETYLPYIVMAIVVLSATAIIVKYTPSLQLFPVPLATTTAVWGIVMFGFATAQRAIVFHLRGSELLQYLLDEELHPHLLRFFMEYSWSSLLLAIISMVCLLLDDIFGHSIWKFCFVLWVGSFTLTLALIVRNERVMRALLEQFLIDQKNDENL